MTISPIFVLLTMLFMHVVDDYAIQSHCLSNLKQKSFWENDELGKNPKYRYDYICALIMHSISWSFCIMLPVALYLGFANIDYNFAVCFAFNVSIHALTDDLKANKLRINLIEDQTIHIAQIVCTLTYFLLTKG